MSLDDERETVPDDGEPDPSIASRSNGNGFDGSHNGNGVVVVASHVTQRLKPSPSLDHQPENYEGLQLEYNPLLLSELEKYLPPHLIHQPREVKGTYMREILQRYDSEGERKRVHKHREYRQKIISNYQRLHTELYTMNAPEFLAPSFLNAISENTEEGFRRVMTELSPGIFSFELLQPRFCEMMLAEIKNFEKWVHETKFRIMRPNTMNKYGAVLDDFGMHSMLDTLMLDFIGPISKVFFPDVGGSSLDSHHGFVVEYGLDRDIDLGFHVDDSEVTLNVCLGQQFSGGELFFCGVRCDKHVNTETQTEEILDYSHVPGRAILHRGRHRHGAKATTSGNRINLLLWCRSSAFREQKKYQKDFSSWCSECEREKKGRIQRTVDAMKLELLRREEQNGESRGATN